MTDTPEQTPGKGRRVLIALLPLLLFLALAGVFALTAHAVTRRQRELAVRAAMGARRDQLVRLVLRRSLKEAV